MGLAPQFAISDDPYLDAETRELFSRLEAIENGVNSGAQEFTNNNFEYRRDEVTRISTVPLQPIFRYSIGVRPFDIWTYPPYFSGSEGATPDKTGARVYPLPGVLRAAANSKVGIHILSIKVSVTNRFTRNDPTPEGALYSSEYWLGLSFGDYGNGTESDPYHAISPQGGYPTDQRRAGNLVSMGHNKDWASLPAWNDEDSNLGPSSPGNFEFSNSILPRVPENGIEDNAAWRPIFGTAFAIGFFANWNASAYPVHGRWNEWRTGAVTCEIIFGLHGVPSRDITGLDVDACNLQSGSGQWWGCDIECEYDPNDPCEVYGPPQ